jgi:hypothetical protein
MRNPNRFGRHNLTPAHEQGNVSIWDIVGRGFWEWRWKEALTEAPNFLNVCRLSKSWDGTPFESRLSLTGKAAWLLADQSKTQISTGHAV